MNSLLVVALAVQAASANPVFRRQAITSRATGTAVTALPTSVVDTDTLTDTLTDTFTFTDDPTDTFTDTPTPTATSGPPQSTHTGGPGSHGSYWYCYFPGSSGLPTDTETVPVPEPTDTAVITDSFSIPEPTDTVIVTDLVSTPEPTPTSSMPGLSTFPVTTGSPTETGALTTDLPVPSGTETDSPTATFTDLPTVTDFPTATFTDPPTTSDLPITSAVPTDDPRGVHTYTIVGPPTVTQVIECIRVPRWGRPPHHPHPHPPVPSYTSLEPSYTVSISTGMVPLPTGTQVPTGLPSNSLPEPTETISLARV